MNTFFATDWLIPGELLVRHRNLKAGCLTKNPLAQLRDCRTGQFACTKEDQHIPPATEDHLRIERRILFQKALCINRERIAFPLQIMATHRQRLTQPRCRRLMHQLRGTHILSEAVAAKDVVLDARHINHGQGIFCFHLVS
ncbi:MAG: hypothetical protein EI684_09535 [Candidatus Viridilinea halotolerans]|uniref:Uncharacterized protein n=1 Tax=Candidatus Viridilinea halotolerans TaxID=2491704 RepID=A0A426U141_9CHLR|nr:MAG: hypothetical protein EI684_09535 [Candidatus Viridilinea halotolerans]